MLILLRIAITTCTAVLLMSSFVRSAVNGGTPNSWLGAAAIGSIPVTWIALGRGWRALNRRYQILG